MTGISQVAQQKFSADPRSINARNKYIAPSDQGSTDSRGRRAVFRKKQEIQPFAVPMPEEEKREVNLDWHLQELVEHPTTTSVDAQTDEFKSRLGDPSTGLGNVHTAVNSLAWPSNYRLPGYDDEQKQEQNVPIDLIVDDKPVSGNIFHDFIPRKTGIDIGTHINEGEIFNFDKEMAPVVKVLVDKTLEQAIMEIQQESVLENLSQARQHHLEEEKQTMADWQAQADAEIARSKEFEKSLAQARKKYKSDLKISKRVSAHQFAKDMLANLVQDVLDVQEQRGIFVSAADMAISDKFLPWLLEQTIQNVEEQKKSSSAIDDIYANVIQETCDEHAGYAAQWIEADRQRIIARQEARKPKSDSIFFHIDIDGTPVKVGPVDVSASDDVCAVEARVYDWLTANCDNIDVTQIMPHGVILCVDDDADVTQQVTDVSDILSTKKIVMKAREGDAAEEE